MTSSSSVEFEHAAQIFGDGDADLALIRRKRVAILGYGAQGRAHALNLRDAGCEVLIGAREGGPSHNLAISDNFPTERVSAATAWGNVVSLLLPDHVHGRVFREEIGPHLSEGDSIIVAAGMSIQYGYVRPPGTVDAALVAPVGPGSIMRTLFLEGQGVPALLAVWQDISGHARELALSYARALGSTRVGVVSTSFREETETDLFGEQAVLCGGLSALIKAGFDTLLEAGYGAEVAYFECLHQVRLIADLIQRGGLSFMHESISETAEFGDYVSGPRIIDDHVRESMRNVLQDIQDGTFSRRWYQEFQTGAALLKSERERERCLTIEQVGARMRALSKPARSAGSR